MKLIAIEKDGCIWLRPVNPFSEGSFKWFSFKDYTCQYSGNDLKLGDVVDSEEVELITQWNNNWQSNNWVNEKQDPSMGTRQAYIRKEKDMEGMFDMNKLSLDQMADYLEKKYMVHSSADAKCICELIDFYRINKPKEQVREEDQITIAEQFQQDCFKLIEDLKKSHQDGSNVWMYTKLAEFELRLRKMENK